MFGKKTAADVLKLFSQLPDEEKAKVLDGLKQPDTKDEEQIAEAEENIEEKGEENGTADQTAKDIEDESVGEQEHLDGNENSQPAEERIAESEGAEEADEKRAEEKKEGAGLDAKIDALIGRMDKLIATIEARAEAKDDKMARAAEKYGLAPSGAGETPKKSYTDEDVKKLLG